MTTNERLPGPAYPLAQPPVRRAGRLIAGLVVALAASGLMTLSDEPLAGASCVGPLMTIDPAAGAPGEIVEIRGEYFGTACNDVIFNGTAGGPVLGDPRTDIDLVILQGDLVVPLMTVNADDDYEFAVRVAIPAAMRPGPATVRSGPDPGSPASFTVTATPPSTTVDQVTTAEPTTTTSTAAPSAIATAPSSTLESASSAKSSQVDAETVRDDDGRLWTWGIVGLVLVAVAAFTLRVSKRSAARRRRPPPV